MADLKLQGISKIYAKDVALHEIDLVVAPGEFVTLLGPSGCGKTTTMRIVAGFVRPTTGRVLLDGDDVTDLPPQKRNIGMVFQDYALFPHLTIAENIAFGLRERGIAGAAIKARVAELLDLIRLPDIGERLPTQISGGQQQRVAFAAPLRILLMDEPLGALDLKLRESMQHELRQLQQQLGITTIYVTHDQGEAMNLSDRIAVMDKGRIAQIGTAEEIYDRPSSRFVAQFVGQINLLPVDTVEATATGSLATSRGATFRSPTRPPTGDKLTFAIRPQHIAVHPVGAALPEEHDGVTGKVTSRVFNGNLAQLHVDVAGHTWFVEFRPDECGAAIGDDVTLAWKPERALLLGA